MILCVMATTVRRRAFLLQFISPSCVMAEFHRRVGTEFHGWFREGEDRRVEARSGTPRNGKYNEVC
jgi:hypothetical protein